MSLGLADETSGEPAKILTVSELTRSIRAFLESRFGALWVEGEISNYKLHSSGHQYFTLKDQRAQISCVAFRNTLPPTTAPLADGTQVQVYGQVTVFESRGQYQLTVQLLQTRGAGLLQAKFEALKRKLDAEGLFDSARKRSLPKFPRRIGVVTSPNGAAIRDILNVLQRRAPWVHVLINPVPVQGAGAAVAIANAIRELSSPKANWQRCDVIVIARGGGSMEDLWEFNEEVVARAVFDSQVPVVSAVGHEIDVTIGDFVADVRAPTPSAAAELIVPDGVELERRLNDRAGYMQRCLRNYIVQAQTQLRFLSERTLGREPQNRVRDAQQQLDYARETLHRDAEQRVVVERVRLMNSVSALKAHNPSREVFARREALAVTSRRLREIVTSSVVYTRRHFDGLQNLLRVLGPDATLGRGYSITRDSAGTVIRSSAEVKRKMRLRTRVSDGEFESTV